MKTDGVQRDGELGGGRPLRVMTAADLDAVLVLEHDLFGEDAWSRRMLEGELAEQPRSRYYLVADDDGVMTGYAGLLVAAPKYWISGNGPAGSASCSAAAIAA